MTNHPEPIDLLAAYLDGELDAPTRATIARHLDECPRCRADVEEQRQVKRFLAPGSPLAPPLPAGLAAQVRAGVYGAAARPRPLPLRASRPRVHLALPRPWLAGLAFAAVLLLAVLGLDVLQITPFGPSPAAQAAGMAIQDHDMCAHLSGPAGPQHSVAQARAELSGALKMPITTPAMIPAGFTFDGGHPVALSTTRGAHMAWVADTEMLSLYQATDPGGAAPAGWQAMQMGGSTYWMGTSGRYQAVFWRQNGMIFLVCGTVPDGTLLDVAQSVGHG